MKTKLTDIWLYCVAIAFTIAALCTFTLWMAGLFAYVTGIAL